MSRPTEDLPADGSKGEEGKQPEGDNWKMQDHGEHGGTVAPKRVHSLAQRKFGAVERAPAQAQDLNVGVSAESYAYSDGLDALGKGGEFRLQLLDLATDLAQFSRNFEGVFDGASELENVEVLLLARSQIVQPGITVHPVLRYVLCRVILALDSKGELANLCFGLIEGRDRDVDRDIGIVVVAARILGR